MDTIYHRALQFRCAKTSRKFLVIFTREQVSARFRIANIVDEQDLKPSADTHTETNLPRRAAGSIQRLLSPLTGFTETAGMLLQRVFTSPSTLLTHQGDGKGQQGTDDSDSASEDNASGSFSINDFDFTGWYCPCCGYCKDKTTHPRYIQCSRCHAYVRGARVETRPNGTSFFRCHDRCGNSGPISGGSISSLHGVGASSQRPSRLTDGQKKRLPEPRRSLDSGKKNRQ